MSLRDHVEFLVIIGAMILVGYVFGAKSIKPCDCVEVIKQAIEVVK